MMQKKYLKIMVLVFILLIQRQVFSSIIQDPLFVDFYTDQYRSLFFLKKNISLNVLSDAKFLNRPQDGSQANENTLTLLDAIELAFLHRPQLQIAWQNIKVQSAQWGQMRSLYFPTLTAGATYRYQHTTYPESLFDIDSDYNRAAYHIELNWVLFDFGFRKAKNRRAKALLEAAVANYDTTVHSILIQILERYFDVQTMKATFEARKENLELAKQILTIVQKRESFGIADASETLQAKTSFSKSELDYIRSQGQYRKSLTRLQFSMGIENNILDTKILEDVGPVPDLLQELSLWLDFAKSHHPALIAAKANIKAEKEQRASLYLEEFPRLMLSRGEYINGRPNEGLSSTQSQESMTSFSVNIPIFSGFGQGYKLKESEAQIQIKEAELRDIQLKILEDVTLVYTDARLALDNLEASRRLLDSARAALDNVKKKYERGVSDIVDVLNVQSAFFDANLERIKTLSEWQSARLRLLSYLVVK